ncbi:hypothetical protein ACOSQ3_026106 [Xanthoceras sorbifolium]
MQSTKILSEICNKLDNINRNFLWGSKEHKSIVHLVKWDRVCLPKCKGGLGIKKMKDMNQALLAKAGWRIMQPEVGLWGQILTSKYLKNNHGFSGSSNTISSSTWKGILHGAKLMKLGLIWRIGDGRKVHF